MKQLIKYAAIAFALCLSVSIIGGCVMGVVNLVRVVTGTEIEYDEEGNVVRFLDINIGSSEDVKSGTEEFNAARVKKLDIEYGSGSLIIEAWASDTITVEYTNLPEKYEIGVENDTFYIREGSGIWIMAWLGFSKEPQATIKVPYEIYDKIEIDKGSGSMTLKLLQAEKLSLENGSGSVKMQDVVVKNTDVDMGSGTFYATDSNLGRVDLDLGSGTCTMENVVAENMDVDSGSGRVSYAGKLTGNCVFECGSGSITLDIYGVEEDYNVRSDMGSGSLYINGKKEKGEEIIYPDAENLLVFDAASGRISINFLEGSYGEE